VEESLVNDGAFWRKEDVCIIPAYGNSLKTFLHPAHTPLWFKGTTQWEPDAF